MPSRDDLMALLNANEDVTLSAEALNQAGERRQRRTLLQVAAGTTTTPPRS